MKKFFIEQEKIGDKIIAIDGDEFFHLTKVLRSQIGEEIICISGNEYNYFCKIIEIKKQSATAEILKKEICHSNPKFNITIFQGLPKGDKLELIIQKCTELGGGTITPMVSDFCIAKGNPIKHERMSKICKEACKQCGRSRPLILNDIIKFQELIDAVKSFDLVLFLYEHAPLNSTLNNFLNDIISAKNIAIIIGSEGGFSECEVSKLNAKNIKQISLGERILRTETASIALTGFISFLKNN